MTADKEKVTDVEMADAEATEKVEEKKDPDLLSVEDIKEHCKLVKKSVDTKEPRFTLRVLRALPVTRRKLNSCVLRALLKTVYVAEHDKSTKDWLLGFLPAPSKELEPLATPGRVSKSPPHPLTPEVDFYIHLLTLIFLIDSKETKKGIECADQIMSKLSASNRRTLDLISARCFFYYMRAHELGGALASCRPLLHTHLRTATLRNDFEGQAVLLNCLLRNYLHYNLYNQADKLVLKATFPEQASNNEWARYYYYLGRIKALQLEYTEAHKYLLQASRKAPQSSASGFKQHVSKFSCTVELLLGNIPERQTFLAADLREALRPYLHLTQAVKSGDVARFAEVVKANTERFSADCTLSLIMRLHHNVVKTAVRTISLAYSRITFKDIASKLLLDSPEDAEFIVAKAIRDGVIEAVLDHDSGTMSSKDTSDVYATREPQIAFNQRIEFCLELHNHSVKAMRFPPKSYNKELESAEDRREREAQDLELAKEMAEDDEDGY